MLLLSLAAVHLYAAHPEWTAPQRPFRIAGDLYYVGSADLAAYLVVTPSGNILINANLESSPAQIRASVEQLGFRWADTRILLNSHAHFDHTAGSARVLRETHAAMMVMEGDAEVVEAGDAHDFSHDPEVLPYLPAHVRRVLHDGDTVRLGGVVLTAHKTAGHTRGCTTWTMPVVANGRTLQVVIVGGLWALNSYTLIGTAGHRASYPGIEQDFEHTFAALRVLPCDIFLGAHGSYFRMKEKLAKLPKEGAAVWIDPDGYRQTVAGAEQDFQQRLKRERAAHARAPQP